MKGIINGFVVAIMLVFLGTQANAAKITVVNRLSNNAGVVFWMTLNGTLESGRGAALLPNDTWKTDAFLAGFEEITWVSCGAIYKAHLGIPGINALNNQVEIYDSYILWTKDAGGLIPGGGNRIDGERQGNSSCGSRIIMP